MSDNYPEKDKADQEKLSAAYRDMQENKKAQGLGDTRGEENLSDGKNGELVSQYKEQRTQHETPRPPARGLNAESRTGVTNKQAKPSQSPANPYGANPPSSQSQEQNPHPCEPNGTRATREIQ